MRDTLSFHVDSGLPEYRRVIAPDQYVVPHMRDMLLFWNGHVCVEYSASSLLPVYLYKYLFKGPDEARYRVCDTISSNDEISTYLRGRYISAMEAMWFVLGNTTYPPSFPSVVELSVYEAYNAVHSFTAGDFSIDPIDRNDENPYGASQLEKYLHRPLAVEYDALLFHEFFENYEVRTSISSSQRESGNYDQVRLGRYTYYYYRRRGVRFCRVRSISPFTGELFYKRLLLLHVPVRSLLQLRVVNGRRYTTYQEAAKHLGIIEQENGTYKTLLDAIGEGSPASVRRMFATMTMHGFPTAPIFYDNSPENEVLRYFSC